MDRIFPIDIGKTSWGDTETAKWNVQKQESASGLVRAIVEQDLPKYEYSLKFPVLTTEEKDILLGFWNTCKGSLLPFYIKRFNAHVENQTLAKLSDGKFQLVKVVGDTVEPIDKVANLTVFKNGTKVTNFTEDKGKISISANQGEVTATYDYYERVRFGSDLSVSEKFDNIWSCSIKVVTAR